MFDLTLLGLVLSCLSAIGAKSLSDFSKHRFQDFCQHRSGHSPAVAIKKHHRRAALAASMMLYLCLSLSISGSFFWFLREHEPTSLQWASMIAISTVVIIALVVWVPTTFAKLWAAPIVYYGWPIWRFLT
jgi:hypothetical protein